jgi:hypothetical protein
LKDLGKDLEQLLRRGDPDVLLAWRTPLEQAVRTSARVHAVLPGDPPGFLKGSRLRGKAALRHALRSLTGIAAIPRLQEYDNLCWLRRHDFAAPRPLAAGVRFAGGLPRYQFLITEYLADCPTLLAWLPGASADQRARLVENLAREVARLHALGFVHRDLFLRNLLVRAGPGDPCPIFIDAWRGGPRPGWRGPLHDLACLFLDVPSLLDVDEQARLLGQYASARRAAGRPLRRGWLRTLTVRRAATYRREGVRRTDHLEANWTPPPTAAP